MSEEDQLAAAQFRQAARASRAWLRAKHAQAAEKRKARRREQLRAASSTYRRCNRKAVKKAAAEHRQTEDGAAAAALRVRRFIRKHGKAEVRARNAVAAALYRDG